MKPRRSFDATRFKQSLLEDRADQDVPKGWLFSDLVVHIDHESLSSDLVSLSQVPDGARRDVAMRAFLVAQTVRFGGAKLVDDLQSEELTHVIIGMSTEANSADRSRVKRIREQLQWYGVRSKSSPARLKNRFIWNSC